MTTTTTTVVRTAIGQIPLKETVADLRCTTLQAKRKYESAKMLVKCLTSDLTRPQAIDRSIEEMEATVAYLNKELDRLHEFKRTGREQLLKAQADVIKRKYHLENISRLAKIEALENELAEMSKDSSEEADLDDVAPTVSELGTLELDAVEDDEAMPDSETFETYESMES